MNRAVIEGQPAHPARKNCRVLVDYWAGTLILSVNSERVSDDEPANAHLRLDTAARHELIRALGGTPNDQPRRDGALT